MRILIIGDIFSSIGRNVSKKKIEELRNKGSLDLVIANVENSTHGKGLSFNNYNELKKAGVDIMTSGNHIFNLPETREFIKDHKDLLRPANFNPYHPGKGSEVYLFSGKRIRVTNLMGTALMPYQVENPYFLMEEILEKNDWDIHLVDFHAESTAEKICFAINFDGKITALWGTHTHVQTADERILPKGTAFITDVGMTGPHVSVIGAEFSSIIKRSKFSLPSKMNPAKGLGQFNALLLEINEQNNKVSKITRINETCD